MLCLAPVAFAAFADVLGIGQRPHEPVAHLVAFGAQRFQLIDHHFGLKPLVAHQRLILGNLVFLHLTHGLSLTLSGQEPPDKLRRVVDDRHDAPVIEPRRTDHAHGADDLTVSVHIGRHHQRGTRK